MRQGTLFLVGVGPGDPELLTLRAARILGAADVVAYPVSNEDTTIALDIARPHLKSDARVEAVHIPMTIKLGKTGEVAAKQDIYGDAAARIAAHLDAGRDVAYLCEGDPMFYGTAIEFLAHFHFAGAPERVTIVPGITSMTAAAAAAKVPLVAKAENLTVLTGIMAERLFREQLALGGSFVVVKIGRHYDRVRALLDEAGRSEHAWYVERASASDQRMLRLRDLPPGEKPYFSLILSHSGAEYWA